MTKFFKEAHGSNNRRFNYLDICWESMSAKKSNKFLAFLADNFINQKEEEGKRGFAIQDLILTNREEYVEEGTLTGTLGASHHIILEDDRRGERIEKTQISLADFRR